MTTEAKRPRLRRIERRHTRLAASALPIVSRVPEWVLYVGLIALSLLMHLWQLGGMAMHHDESIHANYSWEFFTASASFPCADGTYANTYCYNPVYHGPVLYLLTYLSYFLFGVSDATARLPMALAGVGLVASCWMLRPLIGRRAALLTAVLLLLSPTILYFTRFARHDALALLWTFWIVVGLFRYMHSKTPGWLYLAASALALLWATHELVFIIIFIVGMFLILRLLWERLETNTFLILTLAAMLIAGALVVFNPALDISLKPENQSNNTFHFGGLALVGLLTLALQQIISLRWTRQPLLRTALKPREGWGLRTWGGAALAFGLTFVIVFSTFFTYPKGILHGLGAGLLYWLGSQQAYARGDQPWYYYLMQLGIYEILAITLTLGGFVVWLFKAIERRPAFLKRLVDEDELVSLAATNPLHDSERIPDEPAPSVVLAEADAAPALDASVEPLSAELEPIEPVSLNPVIVADAAPPATAPAAPARAPERTETLYDLWLSFGFFWFFLALFVFSWAGEKMPWLTVHMSLPAVVMGAWTLSRVVRPLKWAQLAKNANWVSIPLAAGALIMVVTASSFFGQDSSQAALQERVSGILLLLLIGGIGIVVWTQIQKLGWAIVSRLLTLGLVAVLGLYSVRALTLAAYIHPDVPVELLVYTQTSPDVPIMINMIREIAINETRTQRSATDPMGGNSMKILLSDGENSVAQPFDWYLRGWTNIKKVNVSQANAISDADLDAPVAVLSTSGMSPEVAQKLKDAGYIEVMRSYLNWWFPEYGAGGYKERLYDEAYGCDPAQNGQKDVNGRAAFDCALGGIEILSWPLRPSNWKTLRDYMLFRKLPEGAQLSGREIVLYVRQEAAPIPGNVANTGDGGSVSGAPLLRLVSEGPLTGELINEPRGIATGPDGAVYAVDARTNSVLVFETSGTTRVISGTGESTLQEPSSVAVDNAGNVYVADTWNARIVKFDAKGAFVTSWGQGEEILDPATNKRFTRIDDAIEAQEKPLGFFGPRGVAIDNAGHVFIADTGNKRIVITSDTGDYIGQIGSEGVSPGQFREPIGVAVANSELYVGDTWNGRIQVFALGPDGLPQPTPRSTWRVNGWETDTYFDPFIAVDGQGQIVASVPSQNRAVLFNSQGETLLLWGGNGDTSVGMSAPSGVSFAPDGSVYIAEKGLSQIQRWTLPRLR